MKIVQLVSGTGLNGAIRHCHELSVQLAERGHSVVLAHKPGAWIASNTFPHGVELLETTFRRSRTELPRMARELHAREVELVHSHLSGAHFFGVVLARLFGFRSVATCHMTHLQPHWWWNDRVIAPSEATANFQRWINAVPRSRIDIIPNFVDVRRLQPNRDAAETRRDLNISPDAFVIAVVGEVCKRKAQHVLLRAIPDLINAQVRPHVMLIGGVDKDYEAFLHAELVRLRVQSHVSILGLRHDVANLLNATDCCCLSSQREVMPLALIEAMSMGLPAVATQVGGVAECIRDGVDGFVVKRNRPELLTDRLLKLAIDTDLCRRMSHAARQNMHASFSPSACIPQILASYEAACGRKQHRTAA